jgi:hypothetical protein
LADFAYRLPNRLDVRERRANAAMADELCGEAAKQGLALIGRTAEVVNLVTVALRRRTETAGDASAQAQLDHQQARQAERMDGLSKLSVVRYHGRTHHHLDPRGARARSSSSGRPDRRKRHEGRSQADHRQCKKKT